MPETYIRRHGMDWELPNTEEYIDLTVAKKWREYEKFYGVKFPDPHVRLIDAARKLLPAGAWKVSKWSEEHAYDFCNYSKGVTWGCAACSKAQPLDAVVMTPAGPRAMADIDAGDTVFSLNGTPTRVLNTHDVGVQAEYRVSFRDGTSTLCAGDHLWAVGNRGGAVRGYEIVTAASLVGVRAGKLCVPLVSAPVEFTPRPVDIDPYVLGALLGDGSLGATSGTSPLSMTSVDEDILNEIRGRLDPGYELVLTRAPTYRLVKRDRVRQGRTPNTYIRALKRYGLWGSLSRAKHVPEAYLYNSVEVRRDVLAGLMDTDGCCGLTGRGNISFTSTSAQLADDVAFLVRSLGGVASVSQKNSSYRSKGVRIDCGVAYHVSIAVPDDAPELFRCARKQERMLSHARAFRRRYITSVELTGARTPMKCITIANASGLYLTNDFIVTHNSNDYGLFADLFWLTDPYKTICLVGSTTLVALKSRTWESIVRYHAHLKNNSLGFDIPGNFSRTGYAIVNIAETDIADSQAAKASIQGRALNEGGSLQGAHLPYVLLLVDEVATITNHTLITEAMANLRSGAVDFRAFFLANPEDWANPSCQYCEPVQGIENVDVDTGEWESTMGFHVRHHDGLKSPRVLSPEAVDEFPYLLGPADIAESMKEADNNADAPSVWKMIRGFPRPASATAETVLDYVAAMARKCTEPFEPTGHDFVLATCAGCDPAWTDGGDAAKWQQCDIMVSAGTPMLVFRDSEKLPIMVSAGTTALEQLSLQIYTKLLDDHFLRPSDIAYDASGNQSLGGAVAMRTGVLGLEVNNSKRASQTPTRHMGRPAAERYYDRGSESWVVLAEFILAGQVRGLSKTALRQLCSRRWATKSTKTNALAFPMRMESKEAWGQRESKGGVAAKSPDDGDSAALCALAAKERIGVVPWSDAVPEIIREGALPQTLFEDFFNPRPDAGADTAYTAAYDAGAGYSHAQ